MRTGIPEVEQWSSHEWCIRENYVTIYQLEFQMLPSDCKGWDITGIKQYIVLKVPFFGAHPQGKFLDSLQRMNETNLVRIPDCSCIL